MSAVARMSLGPACGDLLRWLEEHAVTQDDGRRVVWHGSAEIARLTDKAPGTLTQQIGQLRLAGHVVSSRRGHIEMAPAGPHSPPQIDAPAGLAEAITTLAGLAAAYPEHREGLAAAIATISRQSRLDSRHSRDLREFASSDISQKVEEERLPSSSVRESAPRESRIANSVFAIRSVLTPLVDHERRSNPRAQVPASIAQELSQLVTIDELRCAASKVLPMLERGEIKTGIGLIVSHARERNMEIFRPAPPPPLATPAPNPSPLPEAAEVVDDDDELDPDVEQFLQLPADEADGYRQAALATSGAFRPVLEEHPAALTGAAAELWRRIVAGQSSPN